MVPPTNETNYLIFTCTAYALYDLLSFKIYLNPGLWMWLSGLVIRWGLQTAHAKLEAGGTRSRAKAGERQDFFFLNQEGILLLFQK